MSLRIIKAGMQDTLQDQGRHGFQHLGVNPSGAMDTFSSQLANSLLGNELGTPVIEFHFPASEIYFQEAAIICLTGADLSPMIDDKPIPDNQPVLIKEGGILKFHRVTFGARTYLAVHGGFKAERWLNSYSTNLKAKAGGIEGRKLVKGDILHFNRSGTSSYLDIKNNFMPFHWRGKGLNARASNLFRFIKGNEWNWLEEGAEEKLSTQFLITKNSDRMAYRLSGKVMSMKKEQMVSSGVTFGTIQGLPNGELIILMADHQTTGGYPRLAHIISADLPQLAQLVPGSNISFLAVDLQTAEAKLQKQHDYLIHLKNTCRYKMDAYDSI